MNMNSININNINSKINMNNINLNINSINSNNSNSNRIWIILDSKEFLYSKIFTRSQHFQPMSSWLSEAHIAEFSSGSFPGLCLSI